MADGKMFCRQAGNFYLNTEKQGRRKELLIFYHCVLTGNSGPFTHVDLD